MFDIEQHTADIRIRLVAATAEELFADAVRALMAVMKPGGGSEGASVEIHVEAGDVTALLVDFLNEILLRCHTRRESFEPESIVLRQNSIEARLRSARAADFEEDVKAVTYHEADLRQTAEGWSTTLVLDV